MKDLALVEGRTEGSVQPVLQVELAVPLDHVREEVAEERGVLVEEAASWRVSRVDQLVEPDLPRRRGPVPPVESVVGVGAAVARA